ncbi:MAG TPA: hypothetical protein VHB25_07820 [Gemmatimonadaceae bacterium]|nr:hypothetical protein [Gemmatimonadaceae bacterium]
MKNSATVMLAAAALLGVAACSNSQKQTADTTTVPATDTVSGHAVPTTDTVVKTTTTDTLKAQVNEDSVNAKLDSTKARKDSAKAAKSKKSGKKS